MCKRITRELYLEKEEKERSNELIGEVIARAEMEGFSDRLEDLYRSFSSLGSREQREIAVGELTVALQRMSATLESPSNVLAEEATRIIAAEYGMSSEWDTPSTSFQADIDSPYNAAHEMYEYSEALREEVREGEGGGLSLLNYWKDYKYEESTTPSGNIGRTEEERRKRLLTNRKEENKEGATEEKRIKLDGILARDEEMDGEGELIGCAICGIEMDSFDDYLSHMQSSHVEGDEKNEDKNEEEEMDKEKREWRCAQCDYGAGSRKTLWRHGRSTGHDWSRRDNDYSCDKCDYSAGSKFNLDRHRNRHHSHPQELECPLCFSILPSISSFLSHHYSIHQEKNHRFQCDVCSKVFTRKDKVIRHHKVVHESLRPFPCPSCASSFPSGWHLRRHLKSERGCKDLSH